MSKKVGLCGYSQGIPRPYLNFQAWSAAVMRPGCLSPWSAEKVKKSNEVLHDYFLGLSAISGGEYLLTT